MELKQGQGTTAITRQIKEAKQDDEGENECAGVIEAKGNDYIRKEGVDSGSRQQATQEDPELPLSHRHIQSAATYGTIYSGKNSETS